MNYLVNTPRKVRTRRCKGQAKHGRMCRRRMAISDSYCRYHKHQVEQPRDLLPSKKPQEPQTCLESKSPNTSVCNMQSDEADILPETAAADVPTKTTSDDVASARSLPNSIPESSDTQDRNQSGGSNSMSKGIEDNAESTGVFNGIDSDITTAHPPTNLDLPPEIDFLEQETAPTNDGNPFSSTIINRESGNTTNTNCGNTENRDCGNTTTNNTTSQNIQQAVIARKYQTFITNNYSSFFSPDDPSIKTVIHKAAAEMIHITQKYGMAPSRGHGMVELALFDMVIVCDNSGSMWRYAAAMKNTLRQLVTITSLLLPKGITIQFLNPNKDGRDLHENITHGSQVDEIFQMVQFISIRRAIGLSGVPGSRGLGEVVKERILHPMIFRKARARELKRPVITVMITDAQVSSQDGETLKSTVRSCKESQVLQFYGEKAALFLFSRVGNSRKGEKFVRELESDDTIKDILHCSPGSLDRWQEEFQTPGSEDKYTGMLIDIFLTALDRDGTA